MDTITGCAVTRHPDGQLQCDIFPRGQRSITMTVERGRVTLHFKRDCKISNVFGIVPKGSRLVRQLEMNITYLPQ